MVKSHTTSKEHKAIIEMVKEIREKWKNQLQGEGGEDTKKKTSEAENPEEEKDAANAKGPEEPQLKPYRSMSLPTASMGETNHRPTALPRFS